jgi:hypothetical protein
MDTQRRDIMIKQIGITVGTILVLVALVMGFAVAQEFEGTWQTTVKGKTTGTYDIYGAVFKVNESDMIDLKFTGDQKNISMYVGEKGVFARVYNGVKDTIILEYSACNDALTYRCAMKGKGDRYKGYGIAFGFVDRLILDSNTGEWRHEWDWSEFPIKCKMWR